MPSHPRPSPLLGPSLSRPSAPLLALLSALFPLAATVVSCASEATPPPADPLGPRIERHVRELASPAHAGRAPGTPGAEAAAAYIEERLREAGLEAAGIRGYRQPVPLVGVRSLSSTRLAWSGSKDAPALDAPSADFIAGWNRPLESSRVGGEVVFVGYGIEAPELGRDDMARADLRGRWAVALAGEPPDLRGTLPHWSGQPVAKLHAAARRGAAGLVLLSYELGWPEPYGLAREERILPAWDLAAGATAALGSVDIGQPIPWIALRGAVVDSLSAGANLWQEALVPGFQPRPLAGILELDLAQEFRRFESPNILARLPGGDPRLAARHVCLSAHYDGLGRSEGRLYPGVIDNAVGVGELLEVAKLAREEGPSPRSLLFFFPTAEEAGLLGSRYFVEHPTLPLEDLIGCLNKDGAPEAWGRSTDVVAIAAAASPSFAGALRAAVERTGLAWSPNPFPSEGFFFRSDHYSFLRAGVPGAMLFLGLTFEGRRTQWGMEQAMLYLKEHYHRTSDDLSRVLGWEGPAQYARLWLALARELAAGQELPRGRIDLEAGE